MEAGYGLQGILSSTGQVQCGQVHCRLPYTAPPVHLKADMDGPLSNRGEKVNGARLGLAGQSHPAGDGFPAAFLVAEKAPCLFVADPLCQVSSGPHCAPEAVILAGASVLYVHRHAKGLEASAPMAGLPFFRFVNLVPLLRLCSSHTTVLPAIPLLPPPSSFLFLSVGSECPKLVGPRESRSASDHGQPARSLLWNPGLWLFAALGLNVLKGL